MSWLGQSFGLHCSLLKAIGKNKGSRNNPKHIGNEGARLKALGLLMTDVDLRQIFYDPELVLIHFFLSQCV